MARFKKEVLEKMLKDADLYASISKLKGLAPASVDTVIRRNSKSINDYDVYKLVSAHLGVDIEDLLELKDKSTAAA